MLALLLVAVGGGLGAAARFVVDGEVRARHSGGFPWGTFVVNVTGSFLIGVFSTLSHTLTWYGVSGDVAQLVQFSLVTGLCGGYTTFSTATMESVRLARSGRLRLALTNTLGTLLVTVLAATAGVAVGDLFTP
ncbi:fluoride efflux transporter FluC [Promicromonospora sp. NPDC019610]|uniref:fluoride efflux transporter FluC n=1 Tax=Promicromonospora sp. NPDC019610 TaxID=3364405 RepID=UPI0037B4693D